MRRPSSIAARLSVLYALATIAVFTLLGLYFERAVGQHFDALDASDLQRTVEMARRAFDATGTSLSDSAEELSRSLTGHPGLALVVVDGEGRELYASPADSALLRILKKEALQARAGLTQQIIHTPMRQVMLTERSAETGKRRIQIAAAKDGHEHEHFVVDLRRQFWTAAVIGFLLLVAFGTAIARWSLRPIRSIAAKAQSITAHHLDHMRIDIGSVPAELRELISAFNGMLDRLSQDFRRLSDFSADLAHELRTPLSNLVTQTQVALGKVRKVDEYQELLASNLEEVERMSRIISDMLFLAKADNGLVALRAESHRLEDSVARVLDYYSVLAEEKNVRFHLAGTAEIRGDRGLLERMIANLVSNAVHHANPESVVEIALQHDTIHHVGIAVTNAGPTIPHDQLNRIFDRFYRADPSRRGSAEHAGLGLAIAQSIAHVHGGEIAVSSREGKTTFQAVLSDLASPGREQPNRPIH